MSLIFLHVFQICNRHYDSSMNNYNCHIQQDNNCNILQVRNIMNVRHCRRRHSLIGQILRKRRRSQQF